MKTWKKLQKSHDAPRNEINEDKFRVTLKKDFFKLIFSFKSQYHNFSQSKCRVNSSGFHKLMLFAEEIFEKFIFSFKSRKLVS